jgi:hypothetical protein
MIEKRVGSSRSSIKALHSVVRTVGGEVLPKRMYLISRQVLDLLLSDEQEQLNIICARCSGQRHAL